MLARDHGWSFEEARAAGASRPAALSFAKPKSLNLKADTKYVAYLTRMFELFEDAPSFSRAAAWQFPRGPMNYTPLP